MQNRVARFIREGETDIQHGPLEEYIEFVIVDYVWRTERRLCISARALNLLASLRAAGVSPSDAVELLKSLQGHQLSQ